MSTREHLLDWLRDAHAMEKQSVEILEKQAMRLQHYPEMQARVRQHVEETRRQAERLAGHISRLDSAPSAAKDVIGSLMGNMKAFTHAMTEDEVVKNAIGDYAVENFEIACYRSLIAAAETAGEPETARLCQEILREEESMASWVDQHIPMITRAYLGREAAEAPSKR